MHYEGCARVELEDDEDWMMQSLRAAAGTGGIVPNRKKENAVEPAGYLPLRPVPH